MITTKYHHLSYSVGNKNDIVLLVNGVLNLA